MPSTAKNRSFRPLAQLALAVAMTAVVTVAAGTAIADAGATTASAQARQLTQAAQQTAPSRARNGIAATSQTAAVFGMLGIDKTGALYSYAPDSADILAPREQLATDYADVRTASNVDDDGDGVADNTWVWTTNGGLSSSYGYVGGGWNIYDTVFSPGNLAGAPGYDVLGRDADGVLWFYYGYSDGTLTARHKVGQGWNQYTQLTGKGDLTGDQWPDLVAWDTSGVLWLYKGTGDGNAPFETRTRIGGGWNQFDALVATSDMDFDGKADLIARQPNGDLYFYNGTGNATAPFAAMRQVGHGYQTYRVMFS
ncbi:FG-GAP repeat domain-containing protein [Streptomyces sp. NPDC059459]|uniref:FG-GAP repeat domain-containing protein n=1 Tax=Streptomyces sp. NPDC059459 TaxID=3346839 RepID=UPI00367FB682